MIQVTFDKYEKTKVSKNTTLHQIIKKYPNYVGWLKKINYDNHIKQIASIAKALSKQVQYLLVIGVGGSVNTTKASLSMLQNKNNVLFVGETFDPKEIINIEKILAKKTFAINVISKSGTTKETLIAFDYFEKLLQKRSKNYQQLIFVTTDNLSPLNLYAKQNGYKTFDIDSDIGGRFSALTAVGLFPMAFANINIKNIIDGANEEFLHAYNDNSFAKYAVYRDKLYKKHKTVEIITTFDTHIYPFTDVAVQLLAESLGKNKKGVLPQNAIYTRDLHAVGQYVQEGKKQLFETFIIAKNNKDDIKLDNILNKTINYLNHVSMQEINNKAYTSVIKAHKKALVPTITIQIEDISAKSFGSLYMFFCLTSAISGLITNVNPFDQNGVKSYKQNLDHALR